MGNRRQISLEGNIPTDEEMEAEDLTMQAAGRETSQKSRIPPTRGEKRPASSLMKKKFRGNIDLSPFVNSKLNYVTEKLGMTKQSLLMRYILEGLQRDEDYFRKK